jgi:DHA2 family multidrug resistance protein
VIFLIGSALCGIADSLAALVIYRAIQGFGAGALQPTEQAILRQTFPPREQGTAMALFGMAVMLGPAIGPTLGGYIVDNYSWEWIFYINIPVGMLGLFMVASFVEEDEEVREANRELAAKQRANIDWSGIALMSVGLCLLQYVLEEGARNDWFEDRNIVICSVVSVICLVFFVVRELTAEVPVVNLTLFKDPVYTSGTLIGALMFAMLMGSMFLLPIFMQELMGFTAMQSGMALMPRVIVMMIASPIVGRLYAFVSARILVGCGVGFFCIGAWQMSHFNLTITSHTIVSAIIIQGLGFACLFVPLTTTALASIPKHKMTDATGLNSLMRQIGGSVGLAIFATLLDRYGVIARASVGAHLTPTRPQVAERLLAVQRVYEAHGAPPAQASQLAFGSLVRSVAEQATVLSFDRLFMLCGILFLTVLPLLAFLKSADLSKSGPIQMEH